MILRKVLTFVLICFLLPFATFGQEHIEKLEAEEVVEFYPNEPVSSVIARFDGFAQQLNDSSNSRAYVVTHRYYSELPGKSARTLNWVKKYLMYADKVLPERIVLVDGGVSNCPITELWLAPLGKTPKISKEYQQVFADTNLAHKYEEYYFGAEVNPNYAYLDIENGYGRNSTGSLDAFAATIIKEPRSLAYVIVYPEIGSSANTAVKMQRKIKNELINKHNLSQTRVRIVDGGYRKLQQVELWVLPRGVHPPVATPNAFTYINRRARRKRPDRED